MAMNGKRQGQGQVWAALSGRAGKDRICSPSFVKGRGRKWKWEVEEESGCEGGKGPDLLAIVL